MSDMAKLLSKGPPKASKRPFIAPLLPSPPEQTFSEHIFASPFGVEIPLRLYRAPSVGNHNVKRPWVLWFHGGSTVAGSPYSIPPWVIPAFTSRGYHVVSAGYRLSPHVTMQMQIDDGLLALEWCITNLPGLVGRDNVDVGNWVVGGESAGARLSTMVGHHAEPKPAVVLDLYGWTTFLDDQYDDPLTLSEIEWTDPSLPSKERMYEEMGCHDPARAVVHAPYSLKLTAENIKTSWAWPTFEWTERLRIQACFLLFIRFAQAKNFHLLRFDRFPDRRSRKAEADKYNLQLILQADPQLSYPPTIIMHGRKDSINPVEVSEKFEAILQRKQVPVLAFYPEDGDHGFDMAITVS